MITKEYIESLQKQIGDLQLDCMKLFNIGTGEKNVSSQRTNLEMMFYGKILHLKGFVEVLKADSFPKQSSKA
jgi:hypothetical protein